MNRVFIHGNLVCWKVQTRIGVDWFTGKDEYSTLEAALKQAKYMEKLKLRARVVCRSILFDSSEQGERN